MPQQGGYDPFGPFYDSLRIAVPIFNRQKELDAEKQRYDQAYQMNRERLLTEAMQAQRKVKMETGQKIMEEYLKNLDPSDPESVMKTKAAISAFEREIGSPVFPRDESGEYALMSLAKPGMTEFQEESLKLREQTAKQSQIDREEARKDRMTLAQQAVEDRREGLSLRRDILEEQRNKNIRGEQGTKPKTGYMWNDDKTAQVPIPGTEADRKQRVLFSKEKMAYETVTNDMDRLEAEARSMASHPGLKAITGLVGSYTPDISDKARDASAKLKSLKSQVFINVLANMRKASPTGGAVGNVTEKEGDKLESAISALDRAQSYEEIKNSLEKVADYARAAKTRVKDAFGTWDEIMAPTSKKPVTEKSLDIRKLKDDDILKMLEAK